MSTVSLYSKQQKVLKGQAPDVYRYDDLPLPLRVQIVQIWDEAIGSDNRRLSLAERLFEDARRVLCKEYGLSKLTDSGRHLLPPTFNKQVTDFFLTCR